MINVILLVAFTFLCVFPTNSSRENTPILITSDSDSDDSIEIIVQTPPPQPIFEITIGQTPPPQPDHAPLPGLPQQPMRFVDGLIPDEDIPNGTDRPGYPHIFNLIREYPPLYVPTDGVPHMHVRNRGHVMNWAGRETWPPAATMRRLLRTMEFGYGFDWIFNREYTAQELSSAPLFLYEENMTEFLHNHRLRHANHVRDRYLPSDSDSSDDDDMAGGDPPGLVETYFYDSWGNQITVVSNDMDEQGNRIANYARLPIILRSRAENDRIRDLPHQGPLLPPGMLDDLEEEFHNRRRARQRYITPVHTLAYEHQYYGLNVTTHSEIVDRQVPYAEAWPEDTQGATQAALEQVPEEDRTIIQNIVRQHREAMAQHQLQAANPSQLLASAVMTSAPLPWDGNEIQFTPPPPPTPSPTPPPLQEFPVVTFQSSTVESSESDEDGFFTPFFHF